jgi:hypothetical protein
MERDVMKPPHKKKYRVTHRLAVRRPPLMRLPGREKGSITHFLLIMGYNEMGQPDKTAA